MKTANKNAKIWHVVRVYADGSTATATAIAGDTHAACRRTVARLRQSDYETHGRTPAEVRHAIVTG